MKKRISFILVVIMCLALAACSNSRPDDSVKEIAPQASQMKSICELATMKCYYHNVAKVMEEDAETRRCLWSVVVEKRSKVLG